MIIIIMLLYYPCVLSHVAVLPLYPVCTTLVSRPMLLYYRLMDTDVGENKPHWGPIQERPDRNYNYKTPLNLTKTTRTKHHLTTPTKVQQQRQQQQQPPPQTKATANSHPETETEGANTRTASRAAHSSQCDTDVC